MKSGFLRVFLTEWKKFFGTPRLMFWVLGVPLLIFWFLGSLFQSGVPRHLPITVVDYDQSSLSRKLLSFVQATPSMQIIAYCTSEAEAQRLLQRGESYATITIPENFEKDIYKGVSTQAICYTNNQFILAAGMIQKDFLASVGTFSAGININKRQQKGQTFKQAYGDIQSVRIDPHVLYNPYTNYNYYLNLALFPMMFQIVVMVVSVYILGLVMKRRKAYKLYKLGRKNTVATLLGKLLPYTLLFTLMAWIMDIYLFKYIGIPMRAYSFEVFLITLLLIIVYQSMAVFFVSFSKNLRSALTFGGGFSALAFSFSGYTFPMDGIPQSMQLFAQTFPYTHFLKCYMNTAIKGYPLTTSMNSFIALFLFVMIGVIALPKFKRLLLNNGYEREF